LISFLQSFHGYRVVRQQSASFNTERNKGIHLPNPSPILAVHDFVNRAEPNPAVNLNLFKIVLRTSHGVQSRSESPIKPQRYMTKFFDLVEYKRLPLLADQTGKPRSSLDSRVASKVTSTQPQVDSECRLIVG
jgi:hypothetical protein